MEPELLRDEEPSAEPVEPAPPVYNRFLFVDIAALRAKQLRRGAHPRLGQAAAQENHPQPHKAERVAMEEVRRQALSPTIFRRLSRLRARKSTRDVRRDESTSSSGTLIGLGSSTAFVLASASWLLHCSRISEAPGDR